MARLEEVLKEKRKRQKATEIDHEAVRQQWISNCDALISTITEWLKPLENEALLQVEKAELPIYEVQLGEYQAPVLNLVFLKSQVLSLRPVGRFVLGANGRFDLVSGSTPLAMLLHRGHDKWEFAKRKSGYERPRTWEFNRENLEELLVEFLEEP